MRILTALAVVLAVPACSDDEGGITAPDTDVGNLAAGTFRAEVTGAVRTTLEGGAVFGDGEDGSGFGLVLVAPGPHGMPAPDGITLMRPDGGRPGPGEYAVEEFATVVFTQSGGFWGSLMLTGHGTSFFSESGAVTISGSSANEVAGKADFTAVDDEVGRVTITASFRALP